MILPAVDLLPSEGQWHLNDNIFVSHGANDVKTVKTIHESLCAATALIHISDTIPLARGSLGRDRKRVRERETVCVVLYAANAAIERRRRHRVGEGQKVF